MGTLLKYLLYALIIVVIYLVGAGLYNGTINSDSTVGEVTNEVTQGTKDIIRDGYNATKDAVQDGYNTVTDNNGVENTKNNIQEGYNNAKQNVEESYNKMRENNRTEQNGNAGGFQEN